MHNEIFSFSAVYFDTVFCKFIVWYDFASRSPGREILSHTQCFLLFRQNFLYSITCLLPLILALDTTEKILSLSSSHLLKKILSNIDNITFELPLLQAKHLQVSQPLLKGEILQSLYHLLGGPLLDSFQYTHVSLILGSLELYIVLQMKSN